MRISNGSFKRIKNTFSYRLMSVVVAGLQVGLEVPMGYASSQLVGQVDGKTQATQLKAGEGFRSSKTTKESGRRQLPPIKKQVRSIKAESVNDEDLRRMGVILPYGLEVFGEGKDREQESRELFKAMQSYMAGQGWQGMEKYLAQQRQSKWAVSVGLNVGLMYRRSGYMSRALELWDGAWQQAIQAMEVTGGKVNETQSRVMEGLWNELIQLNGSLGRLERLEQLVEEVSGVEKVGSFVGAVSRAEELIQRMKGQPEIAYKCGPYALSRIREKLGLKEKAFDSKLEQEASSVGGISLKRIKQLASELGMKYQLAW